MPATRDRRPIRVQLKRRQFGFARESHELRSLIERRRFREVFGVTQDDFADKIEMHVYEVEQDRKLALLHHLLVDSQGSFLVFARTKRGAERLAKKLYGGGIKATAIHGDRSQSQRNAALRSFSEGKHRVLVATDVAARGIDVSHVAHVVNYDMPKVAEDFVHRIGRTGRASSRGVASTFTIPSERKDLRKIERALSINMKKFRVRGQANSASISAQSANA